MGAPSHPDWYKNLVAGFVEGGLNVMLSGAGRPSCDGRPQAFAQQFLPRMPKDGNMAQNVAAGLVAGWKTGLRYDWNLTRGIVNGDLPHTYDKNYDPTGPCWHESD
ncbi:MAG: hypothetical protein ACYCW6_19620 [Candidatus Xenobia bacterium]